MNNACAAGEPPGGVLRAGKVRDFFSKAWYSMIMRKRRTITGRLPYVRTTPGKQPDDHAGHLAGDRFGGSGKLDNLVSQYWLVNLSSYKKLENEWYRAIQDGKTVEVDVEVIYNGDDLRPSEFFIVYYIDGEEQTKRITNDLLGGLGYEIW